MNSKFKKIVRKFKKKYEIFWHQRGSGLQAACKFLLCLDIGGACGEKNKIWLGKKLGKKWLFCFFLLELLACHLITKTCKHLVHPSHFDAKKIHIFLNFLAILFQIYCSQACRLTVFPRHELLECPNSTKICTHLGHMSIFDLTKF